MAALFRNILVPHDFSRAATSALGVAAELAHRHGGRLTVLHAMAPVYPFTTFGDGSGLPPWAPPKMLIKEVRRSLEKVAAQALRRRRIRYECRILIGQPHLCIVEAARKADSIVMATLGRTGLPHLLIGSVTEKVVRHAPVPVLTIHAARALRGARTRRAAGKRVNVRRRDTRG